MTTAIERMADLRAAAWSFMLAYDILERLAAPELIASVEIAAIDLRETAIAATKEKR